MRKTADRSGRWLYRLFFVWSAVGLLVMPLNPTAQQVSAWTLRKVHADLIDRVLFSSDAIWLWLGAACTLLELIRHSSVQKALKTAALIAVSVSAIEAIGVATGWPFGPYVYSNRLGYQMGGLVPITIPAAWFLILANGHAVAPCGRWRPLIVGLIAVATDLSLEVVAWRVRGYWKWYPGALDHPPFPPVQNFASWYVISAGLDWILLSKIEVKSDRRFSLAVLILINLLFLLSVLFQFLRNPAFAAALLNQAD